MRPPENHPARPAPTSRVVSGGIAIPADATEIHPARVTVTVEDVSRADAPSEVVGRAQLTVGTLGAGDVIPFEVKVPAARVDERHSYAVSVHIDIAGTGEVQRGDFITTQSHPVLTRGYGDHVQVAVQRV